jgi:hypothetical protein
MKKALFDYVKLGTVKGKAPPAIRAGRGYTALFLAVFASILTAIPAFGALGIVSTAVTNVTTTSAWFNASVIGTNASNPTNTLYYGTVDYSNNAALWATSAVYGVAGTGSITKQVTGLLPLHKYYFNWLASDGVSNIWATSGTSSNFWTHPLAPTSTPSAASIYLALDPVTHLILAPLDFAVANGINASNDLTGLIAQVATNTAGISNLNTEVSTLNNATNNLNGRVVVLENASGITRYMARTNASETIEVLAAGTGITVARTNSIFYWNIPAGKRVFSWKARIDGSLTDGGKIYFAWGTNDINNSTVAAGWNTTVDGFREDWNAKINPTALPLLADPTQTVISGLPTTPGTISQIHGGL